MNYVTTLEWMFGRLPMFQRVGGAAYRKNLTNIQLLSNHLGEPQRNFRSVHLAGTNGKGSTAHMLASIFIESGYRCGLYTSPHLTDFRERITINGQKITEEAVVEFIEKNKAFFETHDLSFFEMTVGLAYYYFSEQQVDIAIIETGMGGRLDATNIIIPELAVITNIGLDHTQFLGDTLAAIAGEKAGIIKPKIPVVVGEVTPETKPVFEKIAADNHSPLHFVNTRTHATYSCDLQGAYQYKNQQTVLCAINVLRSKGWSVPEAALIAGFKNVVKNTNLRGRWQQLAEKPTVIADTAHNQHGLQAALPQLSMYKYNQLHIVLGMVNDKEAADILPLFPQKAKYYFCKPNIPRGRDAQELAAMAQCHGLNGNAFPSVQEAYHAALLAAQQDDLIFIGGSTFVVAEIL